MGERENVSPREAERHVAAVFATLTRAITAEQARYLREHLLEGQLDDLFPSGEPGGPRRRPGGASPRG